jgi:hypothetical protein
MCQELNLHGTASSLKALAGNPVEQRYFSLNEIAVGAKLAAVVQRVEFDLFEQRRPFGGGYAFPICINSKNPSPKMGSTSRLGGTP